MCNKNSFLLLPPNPALQRWKDYQLKWSEPDYGSISVTRVPADKVWKPDIVLMNK